MLYIKFSIKKFKSMGTTFLVIITYEQAYCKSFFFFIFEGNICKFYSYTNAQSIKYVTLQ